MNFDYFNFQPSDGKWVSVPSQMNQYNFDEQIYAAYGIYANSWKKFRYQAGLRVEQVYTQSIIAQTDILADTTFSNQYTSLYPSFHTQYDIGNKKEIQLSYSRRVRRISPRDLNPFIDYSDSLNLRTGNPNLKPEFTNSFELGLLQYFKTNSITTTLFYRYTNDEVEDISTMLSDGVTTLTRPVNVSKETNYGLEIVGTANPSKWLRANANLSFYRALMTEMPEFGLEGSDRFSWSARLNLAFTPWKNGSLQLIGNYESPRRSVQEYDKERYFADISIRQDLLNNKLAVSLRLTDIFNTRSWDEIVYGNGFTIDQRRTFESRVLYLGIQYQINNFKRKNNKGNGSNEEMEFEEF